MRKEAESRGKEAVFLRKEGNCQSQRLVALAFDVITTSVAHFLNNIIFFQQKENIISLLFER